MKYICTLSLVAMISVVTCSGKRNENKIVLTDAKKIGVEQFLEKGDKPIEVITIKPKKKLVRTLKSSDSLIVGVVLSKGYELSKKFKGLAMALSVKNMADSTQNFTTSFSAYREFSPKDGVITIELSNTTDQELKFLLYSK